MIRKKIKEICKEIRDKKIAYSVEVEMHDWYTYIIYTCYTDTHEMKLKFNKETELCFNLEIWDTDENSEGFKQIFLSHQEGMYLYEKFSKATSKALKDDKKRQNKLLNSIKF